ncbi:MAG: hypothetical protein KIH01_05370 [Candidatus Freyarchaeota archaeon]|nr:hypothetical protein [Candidatus Jordarchaeia archaeon]
MTAPEAMIPLITQALSDIYAKVDQLSGQVESYTGKIEKFTNFFTKNILTLMKGVQDLANVVREERIKTIRHLNESTVNVIEEVKRLQSVNLENMRKETIEIHKKTLDSVREAVWLLQIMMLINKFLLAIGELQKKIGEAQSTLSPQSAQS